MRKQTLTMRDVIALGFMTLALFLDAGNIIYPPFVGKLTGSYYLISAGGFTISGVIVLAVYSIRSHIAPLTTNSGTDSVNTFSTGYCPSR